MGRWLTVALLLIVCTHGPHAPDAEVPSPDLADIAEAAPIAGAPIRDTFPAMLPYDDVFEDPIAWAPLPDDQVDAVFAPEVRRSPTKLQKGDLGRGAARAAGDLLHAAAPEIGGNCTRFVQAAYAAMGAQFGGGVGYMWGRGQLANALHFDARPEPGDIAFFDHTFDANKNGKPDDPLTHVAIVVSVEPDGDIWLAHGGTRGATALFRMYLGDEPGRNPGDTVRLAKATDPPGTSSLARDLWAGFARVRRDDLEIWSGLAPVAARVPPPDPPPTVPTAPPPARDPAT